MPLDPGQPAQQLNGNGRAGQPAPYGSGTQAANAQTAQAYQDASQKLLNDVQNGHLSQVGSDMGSLGSAGRGATNPRGEYGGYAGGANDAANMYAGLAQQNIGYSAPTARLGDAYWDQNQARTGLGLELAAAQGQTPSVAEMQFNRNLGQSIQSQYALANSARGGGAGLAAAQRQAAFQGAQTQAEGAQQAAQLRAGEMAQARGAYAQQALGMQGADAQMAQAEANRQEQQNALNNQAALGYYGLAQGAETAQLAADSGAYGQNLSAQTAQNQLNSDNTWNTIATIGKVGAGVAMAADVHLKEPGGAAHWSLREEPTFLLARNERTGELRKLATEPLSRGEREQALAPHGAGPLGSMQSPRTMVVGDLGLGGGGPAPGAAPAPAPPPPPQAMGLGASPAAPPAPSFASRFGSAYLGAPAPAGRGGAAQAMTLGARGDAPNFWQRLGAGLSGKF